MKCDFDLNKCDVNCPKYPMCSHGNIQIQISEIQNQISTLYAAITKLVLTEKQNEDNIENVVAILNNFLQDSETIKKFDLESKNEKNN